MEEAKPETFSLLYWGIQVVALMITSFLIPGLKLTSIFGPALMVLALGLVNSLLWDAALFFSVPDSFSLQSLILLGLNGGIFWLLVKVLPGIEVSGILPALVAPVLFTVVSILIHSSYGHIPWPEVFEFVLGILSDIKDAVQK